MRILRLFALVLVGAVLTACSGVENPEAKDSSMDPDSPLILTTTVGRGENTATKALMLEMDRETGFIKAATKFFNYGEKLAMVYETRTGSMELVVSESLTNADIIDYEQSIFTFKLEAGKKPKAGGYFKFIFPATMAKLESEGYVDYSQLDCQDGGLVNLGNLYDLATCEGTLTAEGTLPSSTELRNELAICAFNVKRPGESGPEHHSITSNVKTMTATFGTTAYTLEPNGKGIDYLYLAIRPVTTASDVDITVTTMEGDVFEKHLTGRTYAANNLYQQGLQMIKRVDLSQITGPYTAQNGDLIQGTSGSSEYKISIADGAIVTLQDVEIRRTGSESTGDNGITCLGNATIVLKGTNAVQGIGAGSPAIYVPYLNTLTIKGDGSLTAEGNGGAGIGAGAISDEEFEDISKTYDCGNIVIEGGTITATGGQFATGIGGARNSSCGSITISGGTVTASGGQDAAGIGTGYTVVHSTRQVECSDILISGGTVTAYGGNDYGAGIGCSQGGDCLSITITDGVTKVTATRGYLAMDSVGNGYLSTCGNITIGGTEYWAGSEEHGGYRNDGANVIGKSSFTYPAE